MTTPISLTSATAAVIDKYHAKSRTRTRIVSTSSNVTESSHYSGRRGSKAQSSHPASSKSSDSGQRSTMTGSRQEKRPDEKSVQKSNDHSQGTSADQRIEQEIQTLKPNGWKLVKTNLRRIVEYGHREGILSGDIGPLANQTGANQAASGGQNDDNENVDKADKHEDDVVKIATRDLSLIHAAIPFLPVPVAAFCFFMNIVGPGTGTILSGFCGICMGQPRINFKEGRRFMTLIVNMLVGIAQLGTVTFLLVGWFWSMAWGGLLLTHSLQYREALMQHRQEAVATAAIEALTRDAILRRRDVRTLVQERKQEQGAAALEFGRRRSMFSRLGKLGKSDSVRAPNGNAMA